MERGHPRKSGDSGDRASGCSVRVRRGLHFRPPLPSSSTPSAATSSYVLRSPLHRMHFLANASEEDRHNTYASAAEALSPTSRAAMPPESALAELLADFASFSLDAGRGMATPAAAASRAVCSMCGRPCDRSAGGLAFLQRDFCKLDCLYDCPDPIDGRPLYKSRPGFCMHLDKLHELMNKAMRISSQASIEPGRRK